MAALYYWRLGGFYFRDVAICHFLGDVSRRRERGYVYWVERAARHTRKWGRPGSTASRCWQEGRWTLLPGRGAQAAPGIAHLLVMHLGGVIRSLEAERLHV